MRASTLILFLCLLPGLAQAWWNESWPNRVTVNIDTQKLSASQAVTDGTVLLRLHTGNFSEFFYFNQDVSDLRFIDSDDLSPLKFHVEKFDLINQLMFVWVRIADFSSAEKIKPIYMYYGNTNAITAEDRGGSFDVNQVAAFHFDGLNNAVIDSSAYIQKAELINVERQPASLIGSGLKLDGNAYIRIVASPTLQYQPEKGFAFSTWIKITASQQDAYLFTHKTPQGDLTLGIENTGLYASWQGLDGDIKKTLVQTPATAPLTPAKWQYVALNVNEKRIAVFIDGVEMASVNVAVPELDMGSVTIGGSENGHGFIGDMDEVEMSSVARSPQWFSFINKTQGQQSTLLSLSESEQMSSGGEASYFGAILKSVTLDGWVVIVLCAIMGAISILVMIGKSMMLSRMKKDNVAFMHDYRAMDAGNSDQLDQPNNEEYGEDSPFLNTVFGKHDHYQSSPLYHLYHQGMGELKKRVGVSLGAAATKELSPQSIGAIRAVLDASMVRESQKINDNMVLLTIAIAGGPFLGLLGTVIGVMITFAAIAASGDVNINAIAPGISAALMATVAGLIVAIPALFGYNYLSVRITNMLNDMQVFVDELLTRIAEFHS